MRKKFGFVCVCVILLLLYTLFAKCATFAKCVKMAKIITIN